MTTMTPGQQATQGEFERRTRSRQAKFGYAPAQAQIWSFLEMAYEAAGLWRPAGASVPPPTARPTVPPPVAAAAPPGPAAAPLPPRGRPVAAPQPERAPAPVQDQLSLPGATPPRRWTP